MIKIDTLGLKALDRQLKALPDAVLMKVVRPAVSKAMTPVLTDARRRATEIKDTGLLAKSLGRKTKTYRKSMIVVHLIGPRSGFKREVVRHSTLPNGKVITKREMADPAHYAHLVELGTAPHGLGGLTGGQHPGTKAQPFMRPAFDANENTVLSIYRAQLRVGVVRQALLLKAKTKAKSRG